MKNFDLGLSGCKLLLIENNIVRKYSKNSKYNSRLISQAKKQINFHNTNLKFVKTPKVLKIEENNLAYFDMEYCYGYNYDHFFSNCSILDNEKILNYLIKLFGSKLFQKRITGFTFRWQTKSRLYSSV